MHFLKMLLLIAALLLPSIALSVTNFSFKDIDGQKHMLSDYRGKWVLVNYWTTYCIPCKFQVSHFNQLARENPDHLVILGLEAGSSSNTKIKQYRAQYRVRYIMAPTQRSIALQPFGSVRSLPTTFLISPTGNILATHEGIFTEDTLYQHVSSLEPPPPPKNPTIELPQLHKKLNEIFAEANIFLGKNDRSRNHTIDLLIERARPLLKRSRYIKNNIQINSLDLRNQTTKHLADNVYEQAQELDTYLRTLKSRIHPPPR